MGHECKEKAFYGSSNVALKLSELKWNYSGLKNIICIDSDRHTDHVVFDVFEYVYSISSRNAINKLHLHINQCYGGIYNDGIIPIMFYIDCRIVSQETLAKILETIALHKDYIEPIIVFANLKKIIPFYGCVNKIMNAPYKTIEIKHNSINFFINFRAFREQKMF